MGIFQNEILQAVPRLAHGIRVREEKFGGLVFKRTDMTVYEINNRTLKLLHTIDGSKSISSIIRSGVQDLGGNWENVERVLQEMLCAGVIILS